MVYEHVVHLTEDVTVLKDTVIRIEDGQKALAEMYGEHEMEIPN